MQRTWCADTGKLFLHNSFNPAPAPGPLHSLPAPEATKHEAKCFIACFWLQKEAFICSFIPSQINTKTEPASELDGFSGSYSIPNTPGSSVQVLTVASEGTACLDLPHTMVLLPLLIFEQCVCQLR